MNREVHVRIWERPEVRALRATRQEDQFPPPRLSACYVIREKTFAGTHGNGRDAPIPAVRWTAMGPLETTPNGYSLLTRQ